MDRIALQEIDRQLIRNIAEDTFQRRIEAERSFIASTFKTALWIAGLALSAVIGIVGLLGWQRFGDVQTDAREHARKEVQRYIDEEAALKDARDELDRLYGEALVRTLRMEPSDDLAVSELSRSQIERILEVLLSPETSETLFSEAVRLIKEVGADEDADWFASMQDRLLREGVLEPAFISVFPERRERIVWLLSLIGTESSARALRNLLNEPQLPSGMAHAIFNLERRLQLESPIDASVIRDYLHRRGSDELIASVRALAVASYPTEQSLQQWSVPLKALREDQRNLYSLTLRNLLIDAFDPNDWEHRPSKEFKRAALEILRDSTRQCASLHLNLDAQIPNPSNPPLYPRPEPLSIACVLEPPHASAVWYLTVEATTFTRFVAEDLSDALTIGAHALASSIDRWSSRGAPSVKLSPVARTTIAPSSISLQGQLLAVPHGPDRRFALTTVSDPAAPTQRLPALITPASAREPMPAPLAFDAMRGPVIDVYVSHASEDSGGRRPNTASAP